MSDASIEEIDKDMVSMSAMKAAREAFDSKLEEYGYDPSYWDFKISITILDRNFKPRQEMKWGRVREDGDDDG